MNFNISNYIFQRNRFDYVFYYRLESTDAKLDTLNSAKFLTDTFKKHLLCKNGSYVNSTAINFISALLQSFELEYHNSLFDLIKSKFTHVSFFPLSRYNNEPGFVKTFNDFLSTSLGLETLESFFEIDYDNILNIHIEDNVENYFKIKDVDLSGMSILIYDVILENRSLLKIIDQELRKRGVNNVLWLVGTEVGEEVSGVSWQYKSCSLYSSNSSIKFEDLSTAEIISILEKDSIINNNVSFLMDFNEEIIPVEMGFVTSNLDSNIPLEFSLFGPKVIFKLGIKDLDYKLINFNFQNFKGFNETIGYNLSMYQIKNNILTTQNTLLIPGQVFVLANQLSHFD